MARPKRVEFPGALYHVTSRGCGRNAVFLGEPDMDRFFEVLSEVVPAHNWVVHAYCLLEDRYDLLVETPDGNLSRGMRQLNGIFTQLFNRHHGHDGPVFQGRFKAIVAQRDAFLPELARHLVLLPLREGVARTPFDWEWSSYRATAGLTDAPPWLTTGPLLAGFSPHRGEARGRYMSFVADGRNQPGPGNQVKHQVFLGTEAFIATLRAGGDGPFPTPDPLAGPRRPPSKPLAQLARELGRDEAIAEAFAGGGYTLQEIGDHFGLHFSRVSRICKAWRQSRRKT